jgi:hypothetical protein
LECVPRWAHKRQLDGSFQQIFENEGFSPTPLWLHWAHTFSVWKLEKGSHGRKYVFQQVWQINYKTTYKT